MFYRASDYFLVFLVISLHFIKVCLHLSGSKKHVVSKNVV